MPDPSTILADAFKAISQATVTALRAYEQGERARLAEAGDEIRQLRRERDDAIAQVQSVKQQDAAWAVEVDKWKAELDKADLANTHQSDLIAQLRREAQQWKDQCMRLEESSRNEIQDWKDQFLRVDHERSRLASKLESILSEQMHFVPPYTPKRITADLPDFSTASSSTKRASTSSLPLPALEKGPTPSATKARAPPPPAPTPGARKAATAAPPSQPRSKVIRRVQAVFELPVKEEEADPVGDDLSPPEPAPAPAKRRKSAARPRGRPRRGSEDEEDADGGEDGSGEYVDGRDMAMDEVRRVRRPSGPGSAPRRRLVEEKADEADEDEEDELMMGAEEDMNEVYGHRAVPVGRPKSATNTPAAGRKRKAPTTDSSGEAALGATPGRARKRR